ncbi:hypothetical protein [Carboxylicivirga sp. RSCT41]|uniref:hypothetical protein n=1 Tax=Carboxylicivirga agarovorans TaxID=3417570 RepID=UPI003D35253D
MDKPRILNKYESIKEYQEQLAKEKGEEFEYDIESEMQQKYDKIMSGNAFAFGHKQQQKNFVKAQELKYAIDYLKAQKKTSKSTNTKQASIRQAAIALYFLRQLDKFPLRSGEHTIDANFIYYLTGLNPDKMRKLINEPFKRTESSKEKAVLSLIKDVKSVRSQFELILFQEGVTLADKKLKELENDLVSF